MSKKALSDLLRWWVNGTGRVNATPLARSRNRARLRLEEVENQVVPAGEPAAQVVNTRPAVAGASPRTRAIPHAQSRPVIVL